MIRNWITRSLTMTLILGMAGCTFSRSQNLRREAAVPRADATATAINRPSDGGRRNPQPEPERDPLLSISARRPIR